MVGSLYGSPSIGEGFLNLATAKNVWDAVAYTYSRKGNVAQIYDLKRSIENQNQDEMTTLQYFTTLTSLWQTLDHFQDFTPACAADAESYQKLIERDRIFKFLAGLNREYDQIRCSVLGMDPLPSLREAFAYVQNEESRRTTMLSSNLTDRSALVSVPQHDGRNQSWNGRNTYTDEKDKLFCDHCQVPRHTRETCWKLNGGRGNRGRGGRGGRFGGRGGRFGGRGGNPRAHHTEVVDPSLVAPIVDGTPPPSSPALSSSELDTLRRLMTRLDTPTTASSSFAHSGNLATSVSAFTSQSRLPWIIDSGASDHMTGSSPVFSDYKPYSRQDKVKIADGTVSSVSGKGLVRVSPSLSLSSVLHVPSFSNNLLSISRITRDQNCSVTFFPSHCIFQDLITRRTIGSGREENGLYLLEPQEQLHLAHHTTLAGSKSGDIMLWHRRL